MSTAAIKRTPWEAKSVAPADWTHGHDVFITEPGVGMVATVHVPGADCAFARQRALDNIRLLTAAQDLLQACRHALYDLKGREHDQYLRDVIARATGAA